MPRKVPDARTAVIDLIDRALKAHGRSVAPGYPHLVHTWTSRTSRLYRVRISERESDDVVVKVLKRPQQAAALAATLSELSGIFSDATPEGTFPAAAFGLCEEMGGVIMPYVKGPSLRQVLGGRSAEFGGRRDVLALIERCGSMLARYHARYAQMASTQWEEPWRDLDMRVKVVFGQATAARDVAIPSLVSRSYSDFHPGHIIVTGRQQLAFIDPPSQRLFLFVARDIACFIDKMLLLTPRSLLVAIVRGYSHAEFVRAFLRGYEAASVAPLTHGDRVAIDVNLAFLLKRRLRRIVDARRWIKLAYYAIPLGYQYRRATRRLRMVHAGNAPASFALFDY